MTTPSATPIMIGRNRSEMEIKKYNNCQWNLFIGLHLRSLTTRTSLSLKNDYTSTTDRPQETLFKIILSSYK